MKKILLICFCAIGLSAGAQQFRYGFGISPQKTWWLDEGTLYDMQDPFLCLQYGFLFDQTIGRGEHLAITLGLNLDYTQCSMISTKPSQGASEKQWTIRNEYFEVPLTIRLRSGWLGPVNIYGEGGGFAAKNLRSRGDYDQDGTRFDSDIDYLQGENQNGINMTDTNAGITFGGGAEFRITETASLMIGFYYMKGIMNVVEDNNEDNDILLRESGIHIIGLF